MCKYTQIRQPACRTSCRAWRCLLREEPARVRTEERRGGIHARRPTTTTSFDITVHDVPHGVRNKVLVVFDERTKLHVRPLECAIGLAEEPGILTAYDVGAALEDRRMSVAAFRGREPHVVQELRSYAGDVATLRQQLSIVLRDEAGSVAATAKHFRVSQGTIYRWLRAVGLPTPHYVRSKGSRNAPRAPRRKVVDVGGAGILTEATPE